MSTDIQIVAVDFSKPEHRTAVVDLLDCYARDPMGGGEPLSQQVRKDLPDALARRANYFGVLAVKDNKYIGLVNCFEGFSTFDCRPLLNIHDVVVASESRGEGASRLMLEAVAELARKRGCGKLTLEVLQGNAVAQAAYRALGFAPYELDPKMGNAMFWDKPL